MSEADSQSSMDQWVELCAVDAVPDEGGLYVEFDGRMYAVFRDEQQYYVTDDACPHAGSSLSAGHIDQGCIVCAWHAWPFDLKTGECPDNPAIAVRTYQVRIESDKIQIQLKPQSDV